MNISRFKTRSSSSWYQRFNWILGSCLLTTQLIGLKNGDCMLGVFNPSNFVTGLALNVRKICVHVDTNFAIHNGQTCKYVYTKTTSLQVIILVY
ncbi:hypothetical protein YC2023_099903 [Brassica napus]